MLEQAGSRDRVEALQDLCQQARVLGFPGREWGDQQARLAHRLVREDSPEVWQAACQALGQRVGWDPLARAEVLQLLASPCPELRLRGLRTLETQSRADATGDTLAFLEARLEEAAEQGDAVLLDAVVRGLLQVEGQASRLVQDAREVVRAAAAVHVGRLAPEFLEHLAGDHSLRVRVALASSLGDLEPLPAPVAWKLAADRDPEVRSTLAEALDPEDAASLPFREVLLADSDPMVLEAIKAAPHSPRTLPDQPWSSSTLSWLGQQEEALDANPEQPLEALRPVLESQDRELLEHLGETARDPDLAALCRAMAVLNGLGGQFPAHARARLLEALGTLPSQSAHSGVRAIRNLLAASLRAAEIEDVPELMAWDPGDLEEIPAGPAGETLLRLQEVSGSLDSIDCAALAEVAARLDELRFEVERDLPEPERAVFCLVVQTWSETIQQGIDRLLAGAES